MDMRTAFGLGLIAAAIVLWWLSNRQSTSGDWLDRAEKVGSLVSAIAGLGLLLFPALESSSAGKSQAGDVTIGGDFVDGVLITGGYVESLVINEGDSAEERERKRLEREHTILALTTRATSALDGRLVAVDATLKSDDFAERLDAVREEVAPGAAEDLSQAYDTLLAESAVGGLRTSLASEPLPELEDEYARLLVADSDVSESDFLFMLDQLNEAGRAADSLLDRLDSATRAGVMTQGRRSRVARPSGSSTPYVGTCQASEWEAYHLATVDLADRQLGSQSALAYLAAQAVIADVDQGVVEAAAPFRELQVLRPAGQMAAEEVSAALAVAAAEIERLGLEERQLLEIADELRDGDLACLARTDDELIVVDGDTWETVIGKAISLRDLGRYGEAIEAFERYGQMFGSTDPTAETYSAIAQEFTEWIAVGETPARGIYVFHVESGLAADGVVLESDIIIGIDGREVASKEEFEAAMSDRDVDEATELVVLRFGDGRFARLELELPPSSTFGLGVMSI